MRDSEMADLLQTSVSTIHSLESGRLNLSPSLAKRMVHETGISLEWLLGKKPAAPPIGADGKPYTRATFERTQALKTGYNQPPVLRHLQLDLRFMDKLGFCARLIAILESASARKDYYLARYKVHTALDSLQREFGMDEKVYQDTSPYSYNVHIESACKALEKVLAGEKDWRRLFPTPKPTKKRPLKKRRR